MIRVGFIYSGAGSWTGGPNYMRNLLHALRTAGGDIAPVLIVPPEMRHTALEGFPEIEILRTAEVSPNLRWKVRKVAQRIVGFDPIMEAVLRRSNISVLSHSGHLGPSANVPTIGWIPDFQHRRLPEFFQPKELRSRDASFSRLCNFCTTVIVSSNDAQRDLIEFAPFAAAKSRVLQFVSGFAGLRRTSDLAHLHTRYGFTRPYFFLPNQFWAHKNHRTVVEALSILKERGMPILVLCTGHTQDRRQPDYFAKLMTHVKAKGVEEYFRVLGLVPYDDLSSLMHHSLAMINPSLFEGWSTTVEEAKSLGKTVLLSDIPVHREQAPVRGHYFRPDAPDELADALQRVANSWNVTEEEFHQSKAQAALPGRFAAFAQTFQCIVKDALGGVPRTETSAPNRH